MRSHPDDRHLPADDQDGVVAVEFVLLLPLILVLLFILIDFGRVFNYANNASQIAGNAARQAAVNKYPTSAQLKGQVNTIELRDGSSQVTSKLSVCVRFPSPADPNNDLLTNPAPQVGDPVQVKTAATFALSPVNGLLGIGGIAVPIRGKATMRLEQAPTFAAGCTA